jgi:S1-C subfamily serine protease
MGNKVYRLLLVLGMALALVMSISAAYAQDATAVPTVTATPQAQAQATPQAQTPQAQDAQPFLGIAFEAGDNGARVTAVMPGSPADTAGVQAGDIITELDGDAVTADTLTDMVGGYSVGDEVHLTVTRDGETQDLTATLTARPENTEPSRVQPTQGAFLGVSLEDTDNGVTVREVVPGSPADDAGLQADDVITSINGQTIDSAHDAAETIRGMNPGDQITVEYQRGDATDTANVTLAAGQAQPPFGQGRNGNGQGRGGFNRGESFAYNDTDQTWTVQGLDENSPLYAAGLRGGDVITQINGQTYGPQDLMQYLATLDNDAKVTLTVQRAGQTQEIDVPATDLMMLAMPGFGFDLPGMFGGEMGGVRLGVAFESLDAQTAQEHNLEVTEGALITQVMPNTPAADAGLQENDVVTEVNGEKVDAEHTLRDRLFAYESGDTVTLTVLRDGQSMDLTATLNTPDVGEGFNLGELPFFFGQQFGNGQQPVQPGEHAPNI